MSINLNVGVAGDALKGRKNDLYESPPCSVRALLAVESVPQKVWEPACGPGSIVRTLRESGREVIASDLVDYDCDGQLAGIDFLMERAPLDGCEAIVTNPPFKNAPDFVRKARELVPYTAMLLRLQFLESEGRRDILDAGDLARVYVFRNRLPMMHRHDFAGTPNSTALAFAWFIWDREHSGPTTIQRISWLP